MKWSFAMRSFSYGFYLRQLIILQNEFYLKYNQYKLKISQDILEPKPESINYLKKTGILEVVQFESIMDLSYFSGGVFDYSKLNYPIQNDIPIVLDSPIKNPVFGPFKKCTISNDILQQVNRMPILAQNNLSKKVIFWVNQSIRMDNFDSSKWQDYPCVFWLLKKMAIIRYGKNNGLTRKKLGEKILKGKSQTHFPQSFHDDLDTVFEAIQLANLRLLVRQQKNPSKNITMFLLLSSLFRILSRNKTYSKHLGFYLQSQRLAMKKRINNGELFISDWLSNFNPQTKAEIRWIKIFKLCRSVGKKSASLELDLTISTINKHLKDIPNPIKICYENSIKEKPLKNDWVFIVDNNIANPIATPKATPSIKATPTIRATIRATPRKLGSFPAKNARATIRVTPRATPRVTPMLKGGNGQPSTTITLG